MNRSRWRAPTGVLGMMLLVGAGLGLSACSSGDDPTAHGGVAGGSAAEGVGGSTGGGGEAGAGNEPGGNGGATGGGASGSGAGGGDGGVGGIAGGGAAGAASSCVFDPDPWPDGAFVTGIVSFTPGAGATYGQDELPCVVEGPPHGGGTMQGSTDVLSLGQSGEIVLAFAPRAIVDGPGVDFLVFENPFYIGGDPDNPFAEPAEVSVSDDGSTWFTFPCPDGMWKTEHCAGVHVVIASADTGVSPFDPTVAGGDGFDLAQLGLTHARFVKLVDRGKTKAPPSAGFDLDAIAIVHSEKDSTP